MGTVKIDAAAVQAAQTTLRGIADNYETDAAFQTLAIDGAPIVTSALDSTQLIFTDRLTQEVALIDATAEAVRAIYSVIQRTDEQLAATLVDNGMGP